MSQAHYSDETPESVEGGDAKSKQNGSGADADWLHLNVCGTKLLVKRSTLTSVEGSMLACMFDPDNLSELLEKDPSSGEILLDRDAEAFIWIVHVLRQGGTMTAPPPEHLLDRVRNEAEFLGLDFIVKFLDGSFSSEFSSGADHSTSGRNDNYISPSSANIVSGDESLDKAEINTRFPRAPICEVPDGDEARRIAKEFYVLRDIDVALVMSQTSCSRFDAEEALLEHDGDMVHAIMSLV